MQKGHLKKVLACPFDLCGLSWAAPGAFVGCPRLSLGPLWAVLGSSRGLCGRSWAAPGASVGGPWLLLGPQLAVLGCPWAPCGRSWAALGCKVALSRAGLRSGMRIKAEKWSKPWRERRSGEGTESMRHRARRNPIPFFFYRYMPWLKRP